MNPVRPSRSDMDCEYSIFKIVNFRALAFNELGICYFWKITRYMRPSWKFCSWCIFIPLFSLSQRTYTSNSVLGSGEWYKFSVSQPGVYKIDFPFLQKLGINGNSFPSSAFRLYGNGGATLPEACSGKVQDDLKEDALLVVDGGDGVFSGSDYFLFYATGPHSWKKDSLAKRFSHEKNLYSEKSIYFLTIGGSGRRIIQSPVTQNANTTITSFDERYFYELDTINLLGSGKQWFGEEFSSNPGKQTSRVYATGLPSFISTSPVSIQANCIGRSVGANGRFTIRVNGQQLLQLDIPSTTSNPTDPYAKAASGIGTATIPAVPPTVRFDFVPGSLNAQGWLDWFELSGRRELSMGGSRQLLFRDWNSVGSGNVGQFNIRNAVSSVVWDVTEQYDPVQITVSTVGNDVSFINDCSRLHEYVAFKTDSAYAPQPIGRVENQNLHRPQLVDLILITHASLLPEANRLVAFHLQKENLRSVVVTTDQVYNEFASGIPDPTAIRDFVKMYFDRAGSDTTKRPKYLLLFGDASFDYKERINANTNLVPAYESQNSLDPLSTYTSDDFFGFLEDGDDINNGGILNLLDIGIGRIPAKSVFEGKSYIDKIVQYTSPSAMGSWRNEMTIVADDEDFNLHLHDAETIAGTAKNANPLFLQDKIYLDAFPQVSSSGGARYPAATQAVQDEFYSGTLLFNYTGHGGFRRLAEEVILDQDIINKLNNPTKLPLIVTATCDFAPYDDPRIHSIGEDILLREKTGAIALMTTTRLVFAFSNKIMNQNYLQTALTKKTDGSYRTLGEAVKEAKNFTYQTFADIINNRKFTLLGDPALRISFPQYSVSTTAVNGKPVSVIDTLKALQECKITGKITDAVGNAQPNFNGTLSVSVFDKDQSIQTLGNDPDSYVESFNVQRSLIYKGKASVRNGEFSFDFIVPKDINYQFGAGNLSYYADNGVIDGNGRFNGFVVGGSGPASSDVIGPEIRAWLNDERFVNGGLTNENPVLILKLKDSSGINILGTGIGHDLVAVLDDDPKKTFVLNRFYEAELDNFKKGVVRYQLPSLPEGNHVLKIKAWDVANNSNEAILEFTVHEPEDLVLEHVLNYPNPFTTNTNFWFDHNHPFEQLQVSVRIYTVTGKLVKTIAKTIFSEGNRSTEIEWNGRDDYGDKLGRGVYIYILRVRTADGKTADKIEKLFIL